MTYRRNNWIAPNARSLVYRGSGEPVFNRLVWSWFTKLSERFSNGDTENGTSCPRCSSRRWRRIDRNTNAGSQPRESSTICLGLGSTALHRNEWLIKRQRFVLLYSRSQKFFFPQEDYKCFFFFWKWKFIYVRWIWIIRYSILIVTCDYLRKNSVRF